MRRVLFHPIATLILLVLLLGDAWRLPNDFRWGYSTVGGLVHTRRDRPSGVHRFSPPQMLFSRDPGNPQDFHILRPDDESWDAATRDLRDHPRDCLMIRWRPIAVRRGFWAPTIATDRHIIELQFGENFSAADRAAARRQFVERSGAADWLARNDFQTLATTDIDRTRPVLLGYLHNTLAAATLILFLLSLRWVPQTPAYIRSVIGARRLRRGLCPRCSYTLHGLREPRCPECGQEVNLKAQSEKLKSGI